jgi:hypothetical protein
LKLQGGIRLGEGDPAGWPRLTLAVQQDVALTDFQVTQPAVNLAS